MPSPAVAPPYESATEDAADTVPEDASPPDSNFITPLVEINLTAAVLTAKGVGGVKYGKYQAEIKFGDERKIIAATDDHKTIHTRGGLLAVTAALGALKRRCAVEIYADSTYLLQGASAWFPLGMSLGWLGSSDKESRTTAKLNRIRNQALWVELRGVAARHDICWYGPRNYADGEFIGVMHEQKTALWRRTAGEGADTGAVYAGRVVPWSDALGEYRAFDDGEMKNPEMCCNVGIPASAVSSPLTEKDKESRKRLIARAVKNLRAEKSAQTISAVHDPPGDIVHSISLSPDSYDYLQNAFHSLTETYRKTDRTHHH